MSESKTQQEEVLDIYHGSLWFDRKETYRVYVTHPVSREDGREPRYRWKAVDVETGEVATMSPVNGWATAEKAKAAATEFFKRAGAHYKVVDPD